MLATERKSVLYPPPSRPTCEGRFAIVTNVGGGMRWTRTTRLTSACVCGRRRRVVLMPRRWHQVRAVIRGRWWPFCSRLAASIWHVRDISACGLGAHSQLRNQSRSAAPRVALADQRTSLMRAAISEEGHSAGMQRGKSHAHSITSSARATSVGGTSRPRALAALRLTMSVNLVGCSIGRSPGCAPLRIRST
jgi:hypothetical protein